MPQFNTPINTNDQSLDRVLANPLPVILALASDGADLTLKSTLDEVARDEAGKLIVARLNTAENPTAATRFGAGGGIQIVAWKDAREQTRLDNPTPDQVRAAAAYLLGRGPAPSATQHTGRRAEAPRSSNGARTQTAAAEPITVSQANFDAEVLHSAEPVLVDFWAPWCGPCRMVAPTLEKLAREYAGRIKVAKLNVDQNQRLAAQYGAHSIPLLVLFKDGKPFNQLLGAHPEPNIRRLIEQALH